MTITGRVIIGTPIYSDVTAVYTPVLSGGSYRAGLPLSNLQTRSPAQVARSTDATLASTKFDADLMRACPVRLVGLVNDNFTRAPTLVADWPTVGDAAWTATGTPVRTPGATTVNGIPLDLIDDNDGAAAEGYGRTIPGLVGNGSRIVAFRMKQGTAAAPRVDVQGAGANSSQATFTWNGAGVPVGATSVAGTYGVTILSVTAIGDGGYLIVVRFENLIATDTNTLRFWPAGTTVANTGTTYFGDVKVWDAAVTAVVRARGFSAFPIIDWVTVGDGSWTAVGTPTRVAAAGFVNGVPLDLIGDDAAGAVEETFRAVTFTGNADKTVSFLVKRNSAYASHRLRVHDATAVANRLEVNIDFTGATPVVTIVGGTGVVQSTAAVADGWRITARAVGVVAANSNRIYVTPAANAAGDTASFYVGDIQAWNADEPSLIYDSGYQDASPDIYPAGSIPSWDPSYATSRLTAEGAANFSPGFVHIIQNDVPALARYWRVEISDTGNLLGYVDLGRLIIAGGDQPTVNPNFGVTLGWEDLSSRAETDGGSAQFTVRPSRRVAKMTWDGLPQDEALVSLYEVMRQLGIHGQLYFTLDPTATQHKHRWSFLCTMQQLAPLNFPDYLHNGAAFSFVEEL